MQSCKKLLHSACPCTISLSKQSDLAVPVPAGWLLIAAPGLPGDWLALAFQAWSEHNPTLHLQQLVHPAQHA